MTNLKDDQLREPGFGTSRAWDLVDVAADTSVDALLQPETWANLAAKLKTGDEIIVKPLGLPWRAHLIVMDAGKGYAKVRVLDVTVLNGDTVDYVRTIAVATSTTLPEPFPDDAPVEVKWKGLGKYTVIRKSDGEKLHGGFAIKAEAEKWAIDHITAMAT